MESYQKHHLKQHQQEVITRLNPVPVTDFLWTKGAISDSKRNSILSLHDDVQQSNELIECVLSNDEIFTLFKQALTETNQQYVVTLNPESESQQGREQLKRVFSQLAKDLESLEIIDYLIVTDVLSLHEKQKIEAKATEWDQNRELLYLLYKKGDKAIEEFENGLRKTNQENLANLLRASVPNPSVLKRRERDDKLAHGQSDTETLRARIAEVYKVNHRYINTWDGETSENRIPFKELYTGMVWMHIDPEEQQGTQLTHYCDMLKTSKQCPNRRVLIWGVAGVGKTTFTSKLCRDWAEVVCNELTDDVHELDQDQIDLLARIRFIIYILLRDVEQNDNLETTIRKQLGFGDNPTADFKVKIIMDCIENHPDEVLLICDGLDEIDTEMKCEVMNVITGKVYPLLGCLVTCRPHAAQGVKYITNKELRLIGFNKPQMKEYILYYVEKMRPAMSKEEVKRLAKQIWKRIKKSDELFEMATNPSMLQLLCLQGLQDNKMGETKIDILKDYTRFLLNRYHTRIHQKQLSGLELEKRYKSELSSMGELALSGLEKNHLKLLFCSEKVKQVVGDDAFKLGFIVPLKSSRKSGLTQAVFINKMLQEYLAAFKIVNSSFTDGLNILVQFCSTSRKLMGSEMIVNFTLAMSRTMRKEVHQRICELISNWPEDGVNAKDRVSFLLTLLHDNKDLYFPLPQEIVLDLYQYDSSWLHFVWWLKRLFKKPTTLERFFSMNGMGVRKLEISLGQKNEVCFLDNFESPEIEEIIINIRQSTTLQSFPNVLQKLARYCKVLMLQAKSNENQQENQSYLDNYRQHRIRVTGCNEQNMPGILSNFTPEQKVQVVMLQKNDFAIKSDLVLALEEYVHLKLLDMSDNDITAKAVDELSSACSSWKNIEELYLQNCLMSNTKSITTLAKSLHANNSKLQVLNLSGNHFCVTVDITKALTSMPKLTDLDISENYMDPEAMPEIKRLVKLAAENTLRKLSMIKCRSRTDSANFVSIDDVEDCLNLIQ